MKKTRKKQEKTCVIFRISDETKKRWKKLCSERNTSLTDLIVSSVENKLNNQEQREILKFIEKQDNIFAKIENNINQFAKIANTKKDIRSDEMKNFIKKLGEIEELKKEQNKIFREIYKLIAANDS